MEGGWSFKRKAGKRITRRKKSQKERKKAQKKGEHTSRNNPSTALLWV
jgi:hypothetical protein